MTIHRTRPPKRSGEFETLVSWLEFHRETLAWKCGGLTDEQLRGRAVAPSTLSLLGLVRHMAETERSWFRRIFAGEDVPGLWHSGERPDAEFDDVETADVAEALARWQEECDAARGITRQAKSMDEASAAVRRGERFSLRWILVHMIQEYARHNGHADFLRQSIDGSTGD